MCINSTTTNKCIIEISRHNRNSIYTTIYKHYTLAQIHANIKMAIQIENQPAHLRTNNRKMHLSIEMKTFDNKSTSSTDVQEVSRDPTLTLSLGTTCPSSGSPLANNRIAPNYDGSIDHIPTSQKADETEIRDIFVFDNSDRRIVSIPPDEDITLFEFMDMNPSHLKPFYSIAALRMVYKIYVIDHAYLNRNMRDILNNNV